MSGCVSRLSPFEGTVLTTGSAYLEHLQLQCMLYLLHHSLHCSLHHLQRHLNPRLHLRLPQQVGHWVIKQSPFLWRLYTSILILLFPFDESCMRYAIAIAAELNYYIYSTSIATCKQAEVLLGKR